MKGNSADYFLNDIFRWPYDAVELDQKIGVIVPIYNQKFFSDKGYGENEVIKGAEKVGKWFTAPSFSNKHYPLSLDKTELGD